MKILLFLLTSVLFRIGGEAKELEPFKGKSKKIARTLILPVGISLSFFLVHPILALLNIGFLQSLRIGYGIPDTKTGDKGSFLGRIFKEGWLTRSVAGFIYGVSGATTLFILGQWQEGLFYIVLNTSINGVLNYLKANDIISEVGAGMGVASLIWLIH